jgi:glycosyltransferase involved in cell wall biosynthesis
LNNDNASRREEHPLISIVVPCYNEEAVIEYFFREMMRELEKLEVDWEIICVDDGSCDRTLYGLLEIARSNSRIKVIKLTRNFGKESALTAGLEASVGDVVVPVDADLQDPPELIGLMLEKWREGYDVVYGARKSRVNDSLAKRVTAEKFYWLYNKLSTVTMPANTGDFRLMDRKVVERLSELPERTRFMKGLFAWLGYESTAVEYDRPARAEGRTSWNYWKLWNYALDGLTSFSTMPLRVWTYLGIVVSLLSFVYALFLIIRTLVIGVDVPGYASLMAVMLFLGGIQLISLGVIGEYLGRVFVEVKQRPVYLIEKIYQFDQTDAPDKTG